jgi:hypothetical protein
MKLISVQSRGDRLAVVSSSDPTGDKIKFSVQQLKWLAAYGEFFIVNIEIEENLGNAKRAAAEWLEGATV